MLAKGDCKILGHRENRRFRRRFTVSYHRFWDIVMIDEKWIVDPENSAKAYADFEDGDCSGRPSVPLELKILGCLRMNPKGCAFDAIAELSGMHETTMQTFYHNFWKRFMEELKSEWIKFPKNPEEARVSLHIYRRLGFAGAVGSVDCMRVAWGRCPVALKNGFTGKEKYGKDSQG
jgi:hypothetical protein